MISFFDANRIRAKFVFCVAFCFAPFLIQTQTSGQQVKLHGESVVEFATITDGQAALAVRDVFVKNLSPFDRQSRMQVASVPTTDQYIEFAKKHVVEWTDKQKETATQAIQSASAKLASLQIPFPKKVLLVTTDGKEEGGAAYCRGPAVVLPQNMLKNMSAKSLERLLLHELFHVISNQNPDLRKKLYAVVGFKPCNPVPMPPSMAKRKLTNPDGPTMDYYVTIKVEENPVAVIPILFAKQDYDAKKGGSFFQYLQFQLMAIENREGKWQPMMNGELPVMYAPQTTASYFDNIGRNTGYIIHPDEVLADNFVFLVQKKADLKTPRIVDEMRAILGKK